MQSGANEAFSRILIDKALEFSGWNLLDSKQVRFELNGTTGRADYVLSGQRGPLCVLEAKREDVDPYDAKEQARGYTDTANKALPEAVASRPELEVKAGDLLFTRKNTYELVGACAFVFETRPKLMLSDLIFRFRLKSGAELDPIFLWGLLTVPSKRRQVQTLAGGSAGSMPNISKGRLIELPIEVPPMQLQKEFAQRVRKIRELEAGQANRRAHLDALFQSMLHRAFNGEL